MYSDESAADLTVTVEDEDYQAEAVVDLDDDGVQDTAMVETDDGAITFTDTDADGRADLMTQLDADGDIIAQATFDESTGEWVHVDTELTVYAGSEGSMTVDTPRGEIELGAPTHDTDNDGKADSLVIHGPGGTMIFTDADEDGDADYITAITDDGQVTITEHTGDGEWTEIGHGGGLDGELGGDGDNRHAESGTITEESNWSAAQADSSVVHIDPSTGNWIRG